MSENLEKLNYNQNLPTISELCCGFYRTLSSNNYTLHACAGKRVHVQLSVLKFAHKSFRNFRIRPMADAVVNSKHSNVINTHFPKIFDGLLTPEKHFPTNITKRRGIDKMVMMMILVMMIYST